MPYRIDVLDLDTAALDRLIELGALDIGIPRDRSIAALMPDSVKPEEIAHALNIEHLKISPATGRDEDSVWILDPRPIRVGRVHIVPDHHDAQPGVLRLIDSAAFGTGLHPTTALCLEILDDALLAGIPDSILDVGIGSGVLALAALTLGVPRALGIDIDDEALRTAAENAQLNDMRERLELVRGGPNAVTGTWGLVVANVLAAPLIEMAPALVRRLGHHARLVLSGIARSVEPDVQHAYRRLGLRMVDVRARAGWVAIVLQASW